MIQIAIVLGTKTMFTVSAAPPLLAALGFKQLAQILGLFDGE